MGKLVKDHDAKESENVLRIQAHYLKYKNKWNNYPTTGPQKPKCLEKE